MAAAAVDAPGKGSLKKAGSASATAGAGAADQQQEAAPGTKSAAAPGTKSAAAGQGSFKYKGKKVMTQLDKGNAELVKEETAKGEAQPMMNVQFMQTQETDYTNVQTQAGIFRALRDVKAAKGEKPPAQVEVLDSTGKVFLNEKYKPVLMSGQTSKMTDADMARNVNLKAYKEQLENLRKDCLEKGKKDQAEMVEKVQRALDKKQTLTLGELKQIFEGVAQDVNMSKPEAEAVIDNLVKMGMLNKADADELKKGLQKQNTIKANELAQKAAPAMVIRNDGTVGTRQGYSGNSFRIPKNLPLNKPPPTRKQIAGQLCGPSKPFMQNIAIVKEATVTANLD